MVGECVFYSLGGKAHLEIKESPKNFEARWLEDFWKDSIIFCTIFWTIYIFFIIFLFNLLIDFTLNV